MNLYNVEEEQVEFIIECVTKASVQTQEQQELLAWLTLQLVREKKGDEWKAVVDALHGEI